MFMKTRVAMGLAVAFFSGSALAVNMVTLPGTNVSFTYDADLLGLYGTPMVVGNSLVFTPTQFLAGSTNGAGIVMTSATLNVGIVAHSGYQFSSISLTERGDYYLIGSDAMVAVGGQIRVQDADDPINNEVTDFIVATAPFNAYTTLGGFTTTNWTANASVVIPNGGAGWGGNDGIVDGINLTIENLLIAHTSERGSAAFIEKKLAGSSLILSAVPEAETYALMLTGLGLVGWMARRRLA